jgi:hypothetical protein
MLLKDCEPLVLAAATKEITQTALTIAVFGSSGVNNPSLTRILFPNMVARGLLTVRKKGNAKLYKAL